MQAKMQMIPQAMRTLRPGKLDLLFHISRLLDLCAGGQLANAIYARQIYGAMAIKRGCVIVWKVIMTAEVTGLRH